MIVSLLLKKALPFALTFVVGTALGGLTWLFGGSEKQAETALVTRTYDFKRGCGSRMRRHDLVAETKPLVILSKPDARWPSVKDEHSMWVSVTFGADGKVRGVEPVERPRPGERRGTMPRPGKWEAVESAARQIQFTPEMVNSVPVTVTKDVEIRFMSE